MSLRGKSILVAGGAGFIGSHLVDLLIKEHPEKIVVVDNLFLGKDKNLQNAKENFPNLTIIHEDASDYDVMKKTITQESVDVVFNLAVIPLPASLDQPVWTFNQNVAITSAFCELARNDFFKTLIHFSSSEAYGTCVYAPMDENHPMNATTPYAASKSASDLLVLSYYRTFGINTSIIRPFNNFGPRQNEHSYAGVIPLTINRILNGKSPIIHGTGQQTRDYLYVTDTANAAIKIYNTNKTRGKILNIASGQEITIEYLIRCISDYLNWKEDIIYEPERQGDVHRHIANINLAKLLIKFQPAISFKDGLKSTIDWYLNELNSSKI